MYKTKKNQSENEHCENLSDEGSAQEVEFHRDTSLFEEDRKEFLKRMRLVKSSKPTFNYRQVQETSKLTTGRTFWSIEETDELVKTWLMLENDFFRNKRNASVWERLDLSMTNMSLPEKLKEFPHYLDFTQIKKRSSSNSSKE
ncbi:hypothetical protein AX774_g6394 [Zancudomyces culisetae]|uniref:Uncharacterized protein n=1 Tax=Zancudomyces culisetae TaxID=1213189 RepID=A0A1R1PGR6_ZANCU|nr:hypothetical protein AX774_g6394 [Zancudomyces culisetae]|eukprot:OMH80171.1 hypothetical protein AX774_g6394 [Zancudomyces culisetae]